ncbi:MAG TPA: VWA domain-containing protein, partial [Terriglobia bacterium]|nr:VWA domain-containing protein [Terriglobia bacterium]
MAIVFKVLQDHGQPVHNLGREYVSLRVDGHDIPKFNFEYRSVTTMHPTRIVLVLDASGSMRYGGKIERLKQSAINVIQGMGPTDECAIVAFSTKPVLLTGFSDDKKLLMDKVLGIRPAGYTAMYDAVFDALNQFAAQPQESDRLVLLISDGQEEGKSMFTLADIAPRIYQMGHLTIHTFDLNDKKPSDDLKRLADISGGSYTYDSARDDVFTAFSQFLTQYRKAYVLSYQQPPGLPSQLHKATLLLDVDGVQQQLATEYSDLISETGFVDANPFGVYYAGGLAVLALGIAGAVVLMRKKRQGDRYSGVRMAPTAEPKFALSPPVAPQPEEKTRILGFNIPDE